MEHSCKKCGRPLEGAITRPLRAKDGEKQQVLAAGDTYMVRAPMGYEVIGECQKHGLQRYVPLGLPEYIEAS